MRRAQTGAEGLTSVWSGRRSEVGGGNARSARRRSNATRWADTVRGDVGYRIVVLRT
jgi:hypothetical protein